jgi:hypothetical protein
MIRFDWFDLQLLGEPASISLSDIRCETRLGGLLKL